MAAAAAAQPATAAGGTCEGHTGLTPVAAQSRCPEPPLLGHRAFRPGRGGGQLRPRRPRSTTRSAT
eukprot:11040456-Alexandrium_andersonii.AAC.1